MRLEITSGWLATLPPGLLAVMNKHVDGGVRTELLADGRVGWAGSVGVGLPRVVWLVLEDPVTAAVVAMRIVRLWSARAGVAEIAAIIGGTNEEAWATWCEVMALAMSHDPMSPDQAETLARLARAAMEAA